MHFLQRPPRYLEGGDIDHDAKRLLVAGRVVTRVAQYKVAFLSKNQLNGIHKTLNKGTCKTEQAHDFVDEKFRAMLQEDLDDQHRVRKERIMVRVTLRVEPNIPAPSFERPLSLTLTCCASLCSFAFRRNSKRSIYKICRRSPR